MALPLLNKRNGVVPITYTGIDTAGTSLPIGACLYRQQRQHKKQCSAATLEDP